MNNQYPLIVEKSLKVIEHLNEKFGVKVELIHREQNIEQTFEAKL